MKTPAKWVSLYYPFTAGGTILFCLALYLLRIGLAASNPYALLLSLISLLTLISLALGARLQALRFSRAQLQWDSSGELVARREGMEQRLHVQGARSSYFYRLHFSLRGKMAVGREAWLYISREISCTGEESQGIQMGFPLCGELQARGSFKIRDIFGLTRAGFGTDQNRQLTVQPAPVSRARSIPIDAAGGLEEKSRRKSSDEEKYYMREYIPGDRFRDINWKASSRFSELFTRISPLTQGKIKIIAVDFRHFRRVKKESVESIAHLNYIKSWLLSFLRTIKMDNPEYNFLVRTGRGSVLLESEEDIDRFSRELSSLFFQSEPADRFPDPLESEFYIFTTPFDENLPLLLSAYPQARIHLFRTVSADGHTEKKGNTFHLFRPLKAALLPGRWILLREKELRSPALGQQLSGRLEEEVLEVRVI